MYITRVIRRSRSYIPFSASQISYSEAASFVSASTAPRRFSIAVGSMRGCSIHARSFRLPIAVTVLSSTHISEPRFSLVRSVSVSSRLRRVVRFSPMNSPSECTVSETKRFTVAFWVSPKYRNIAHSAFLTSGISEIPSSAPLSNCSVMMFMSEPSKLLSSSNSHRQRLRRSRTKPLTSLKSRKSCPMSISTGLNLDSSDIISCSSCLPDFWKTCTSPVEISAKTSAAAPCSLSVQIHAM